MAEDARKNGEVGSNESVFAVVKKTFPMCILWFVVMAGWNTFGVFTDKKIIKICYTGAAGAAALFVERENGYSCISGKAGEQRNLD